MILKKKVSEKMLINHLRQALFVVDQEYRVLWCNEGCSQMLEMDPHKITSQTLPDLLPMTDEFRQRLEKVFEQGKNYDLVEHELKLGNHSPMVVEISVYPFQQGKKVETVIISLWDRTNLYLSREKAHEKDLLYSIGEFVSSIAHEIQNPMSGIKGAIQLLQRELERTTISREPTQMVLKEITRIEKLLRHLLLHSQPIPLELSTFNLHELLDRVIWFQNNSVDSDVVINRVFDPSLPEIQADRDKLHQVFLNLVCNAAEASVEGGQVYVRTSYCPRWRVSGKQLDPNKQYLLVEVEDEGPGVDPENVDNLFRPMFSTKKRGTGLGLSVSFRIISEHGGLLQYRPASKQGAIFEVYIPIKAPGEVDEHEQLASGLEAIYQ